MTAERPLTVPQAAQRLGTSPQTVIRHIESGNLAAHDIGTTPKSFWRVAPAALAQFIEGRKNALQEQEK